MKKYKLTFENLRCGDFFKITEQEKYTYIGIFLHSSEPVAFMDKNYYDVFWIKTEKSSCCPLYQTESTTQFHGEVITRIYERRTLK